MVRRHRQLCIRDSRKTGADLLGESETTGGGVKALVQSVVGATFGSVAKIAGAADALLSGVAGHREEVRQKPKHVGEGLVQGGERVWRALLA